jgi:Protein of unknown function (DUF1501)
MIEVSVTPAGGSVLSRRALLRASLATGAALALPGLLRASKKRRDVAVIQIWLGGGPSHHDTYDLKPDAPAEIRGPFKPIATNVNGLRICELLSRQAKRMDRLAVVRSLRHTSDDHAAGMHWVQTGHSTPLLGGDLIKITHPSLGSVVARLRGPNRPGMMPYVHVAPDPMGFAIFPRIFDSAYLGPRYDPLRVLSARKKPDVNALNLDNSIGKVHFTVPQLDLLPEMTSERLGDRERLRRSFDRLRRGRDGRPAERLDEFQRQALELVSSDAARRAFELDREDPRLRDRYGRNAWGQGALLCRRLVEAGVTFVTLNTDSFSGQWDNHVQIKAALEKMLPVYDQMLVTLIDDLVDRGLYERVLVLVWGEFGRTPKINPGAGRDHWGRSGFALLGGGGLRGGVMVGSTTADGGDPRDRPLWPGDVLATVYHVLGIDPEQEFLNVSGQPTKVLSQGEAIRELV